MRQLLVVVCLAACSSYSAADPSPDDAGIPRDPTGRGDADAGARPDAGIAPDGGDPPDAPVSPDAGSPACLGAVDCERIVFVSSAVVMGKIGGLLTADGACQKLADAGTKTAGRHFRAWLSDEATQAEARVPHGSRVYKRTDGQVIALDFDAFISGAHGAPINLDENGNVVATSIVWTGTASTGKKIGGTCTGWTNDTNVSYGRYGSAAAIDEKWSNSGADTKCDSLARFYCVEN